MLNLIILVSTKSMITLEKELGAYAAILPN